MAIGGRYEADQHYIAALSLFNRNLISEAIQRLGRAIQLAPQVAEFYATRGYFYLEDRDYPHAEADFDSALSHNAYEGLANYGKALIAYRRQDWPSGLRYALNAWATQNDRPEYLYLLALCQFRQAQPDEARQNMELARAQYDRLKEGKWAREAERWLTEFERVG